MSTTGIRPEDTMSDDPRRRAPLVTGSPTFSTVTEVICRVAEAPKTPLAWYVAMVVSGAFAGLFLVLTGHLLVTGVGVWGNNAPVYWAFDITNFVFWVGIGHAGTLISAVLFILRQKWRTSINRLAEAMTVFAVMVAGLFPAIHIGRVWVVYWLLPYPNQMGIWPNFRSPLLWDVVAVTGYATVSALFWYVGMIPDLATLRDRARHRIRRLVLGAAALGWRGSARQWQHYEKAYLLLAAVATPLVVSVHSVVSFDFAVSIIPGWHTTIFPVYFVAGAIFSGLAMVITLLIPARAFLGLEDLVTIRHFDNINKVILATSLMVGYAYGIEVFSAWYGGGHYEQFAFLNRAYGPYWWAFWTMVVCNVAVPQLFWLRVFRTQVWLMLPVVLLVNVGMWFERFVIIVTSLSRDYLPSAWRPFTPTWVDFGMLLGSFGVFFFLFLLFLRFLPIVAMAEMKTILPGSDGHGEVGQAKHE